MGETGTRINDYYLPYLMYSYLTSRVQQLPYLTPYFTLVVGRQDLQMTVQESDKALRTLF